MGELSVTEEDYVIAVDGGLSYCGLLNVEPDLIIGDFRLDERTGEACCGTVTTDRSGENLPPAGVQG